MKPDRSADGVRYAVVPKPLRVLSVAYATACGGTGRRDFLFGAIWGRRLVPRLARSGRLRAGMTDGPVRNERTGCWRLGSDGRRPRCGGPGRSDGRSASCGHRAGTVRTPVLPHSSFDPVRRFRRRFCCRYAGGTGHRKGRAGTVAAVPNFWNEIIKTRFFMLYLRNGAFSLGRRRAEAGRAPERENGYLT